MEVSSAERRGSSSAKLNEMHQERELVAGRHSTSLLSCAQLRVVELLPIALNPSFDTAAVAFEKSPSSYCGPDKLVFLSCASISLPAVCGCEIPCWSDERLLYRINTRDP